MIHLGNVIHADKLTTSFEVVVNSFEGIFSCFLNFFWTSSRVTPLSVWMETPFPFHASYE